MVGKLVRIWLWVQLVRHIIALANQPRVRRFLATESEGLNDGPEVIVVLPVLEEARALESAVDYFTSLLSDRDSLLIVTSARQSSEVADGTVDLACALAERPKIFHAHLDDSAAFKSDQINFAAHLCDSTLATEPASALVVIYDVDSRPDPASISAFRGAADRWPDVSIFQQSARFRLQNWDPRAPLLSRLLADAGALRANRFVMTTELPRLLARRPGGRAYTRLTARLSFGHLVGHGLGIRARFLVSNPLPDHTPMEDMFYGFQMATRAVPVVPLPRLDTADVPASPAEQFQQLQRWFLGPSRFPSYVRHPNTPRTGAAYLMGAVAFLISLEWLMAVGAAPMALASSGLIRTEAHRLIVATTLVVGCELVGAELTLGAASDGVGRRAARVVAYPLAASIFGLAGWSSIVRRLAGRPIAHKTRHPGSATT